MNPVRSHPQIPSDSENPAAQVSATTTISGAESGPFQKWTSATSGSIPEMTSRGTDSIAEATTGAF